MSHFFSGATEAIILIKKKDFSLRSFTSITLFLSFFALVFSGLAMYLRPEGSVARWIDWSLLGLSKNGWEGVHTFFSFMVVVFSVIHLFLNGKALLTYILGRWKEGIRRKKELCASAGLVFAVLILAVFRIPPVGEIMDIRDNIKHGHYTVKIIPPEPDFEQKPLSHVIRSVNMPVEIVLERLRGQGLIISDDQESLQKIAKKNKSTPQALYLEIIQLSVE